jgi:hypothetical protein
LLIIGGSPKRWYRDLVEIRNEIAVRDPALGVICGDGSFTGQKLVIEVLGGGSRAGSFPSNTRKNSKRGRCWPSTTMASVSGTASTRPMAPHKRVQNEMPIKIANGDSRVW